MKYIKLDVWDKNSCNLVLAGIMYLEYIKEKEVVAIYPLNTLDTIYLNISKKEYENILEKLSKSDFISINICGYTQPFESFEEDKKGKQYKQLDEKIKENADKQNKGKKIIID